ncbi:hypothetical protein [Prevotella sp. PTAC]|uniref:hypothetical protein n=1 Tax=Prevotella sp. PTAC TaxID=2736295 RepID=UPI00155421E0|nr:hypothetical protein [Prevotella sp. PTAC]NPD55445.1 hypothetical protein [Prevotella sp. PTAC]
MQKIGAISKSPNRYQQLSIIAFAICVSIIYGIIDYSPQRYVKKRRKANFTTIHFTIHHGIKPTEKKNGVGLSPAAMTISLH